MRIVSFLRASLGLSPKEGWILFQFGAAALLVANYGLQPGTEISTEWIAVFTFLVVFGGLVLILVAVAQVQAFISGRRDPGPRDFSKD